MSECAVADGICHCSGSSEAQLTKEALYGVLEDPAQVVIGDSAEPEQSSIDYVDYCVEGDLLHWRQESDSVELVLRRIQ
jgi:hypothetical protein